MAAKRQNLGLGIGLPLTINVQPNGLQTSHRKIIEGFFFLIFHSLKIPLPPLLLSQKAAGTRSVMEVSIRGRCFPPAAGVKKLIISLIFKIPPRLISQKSRGWT
jgi:hypothetical protein